MSPAAAFVAAAVFMIAFMVTGTYLMYRVVNAWAVARIGDLLNERDYLRAQLEQKDRLNVALQNRVVDLGGEIHFVDGALNETRLTRRDDP